jgi:hypothetical protein
VGSSIAFKETPIPQVTLDSVTPAVAGRQGTVQRTQPSYF